MQRRANPFVMTHVVALVLVACSGGDGGEGGDAPSGASSSSSSSSSGSSGGSTSSCAGKPEGAYRCDGNSGIEVCEGGDWKNAGSCNCAVKVGDPRKPPYSSTCKLKIGSTNNAIVCSYASVECKECLPGQKCKTTCVKCAGSSSSSCCP